MPNDNEIKTSGEPGFGVIPPSQGVVPGGTTERNDDWKLDKIVIEFNRFGEDKGKYTGKISFQNGEWESFSFKLYPEMAEQYIKVISEDVVKSAESLGSRLIESLGLKK